ncbi:MAG: DUF7450 family protein [Candidatus Eiseniibacteriota bacterium]
MNRLATHRRSALLASLVVAALLAVLPGRAGAQVDPLWDHYKVYFQNPPFTIAPIPVGLADQFGPFTHDVHVMELFANPVEKTVGPPPVQTYPINDSLLHYSWWRITPQPFFATVAVTNQFGDQTLNVHDAAYLLNPAIKNPVTGQQPPTKNHYKCYFCDGVTIDRPVTLVDQFDRWDANVLFPRFFCNPVEKRLDAAHGGQVYPIVDGRQHYVCYEYQPPDPTPFEATMTDQFVDRLGLSLHPSRLLCVPTDKTGVTSTGSSTWGRIKILYR